MLISLLVLVVVLGLILYCVQLLPIAPPFKQIAVVLVVIIAIIYLSQFLPGGFPLR